MRRGGRKRPFAIGAVGVERLTALIKAGFPAAGIDTETMTGTDLAEIAPVAAWPVWLSAALADLCCMVANMFRDPDKSAPLYRDDFLDMWGLPVYAREYRLNLEAARKAQTAAALAEMAAAKQKE